ncbi:MAG TPA: hypothetical protein VFC23_10020 [Thermoanaerobaculia bacterium]|nr:hypothetical protein [Thermoanaerobaculia bacterium]
MSPHDPLFKRLLRSFFVDFLRLVAPDVAERLDLTAPVFLDKELLLPGDSGSRVVDLLVRIPLLGDTGRSLLIHVEIEARARRGMGERLREYHRWIQSRYPGQILSIVLYLRGGRGGVREEVLKEDLAGPGLTGFRYLSFGLERCHAVEYLSRPEPLAWALAALMKPARDGRARLKLDCLTKVAEAPLDDEGRLELANCIETYVQLSPEEAEELASLGVPEDRRTKIVSTSLFTWTDRLIVESEKQGFRKALLHQLERRFGPIPDDVRQRVEKIRSEDRLTRLLEKVLTARSLKEMRLG